MRNNYNYIDIYEYLNLYFSLLSRFKITAWIEGGLCSPEAVWLDKSYDFAVKF